MAISFVNKATGTNTATLPAFTDGDLAVVFAFRDGSTTAPTIPAGWTQILTRGTTTSCSQAVGWRRLQTGDTTVGTWTNATSTIVHIYHSSTKRACVGGSASNGGTTNTINYPAVTMQRTDSTSWVAGFVGHRSTNQNIETAPAGMTARSNTADATDEAAGHDTNGTVSSWSSTNFTGTGTASGWQSATVEIIEGIAFRQIVVDQAGPVATNANAIPFPVQKGDLIIAVSIWDTVNFTSMADNASGGSNTYTQIGTEFPLDLGGGNFVFERRYWAIAKATESLTVTSTLATASVSGHSLATVVYSGVSSTSPVDVQDIQGVASTTSETLAVTTTTLEDRVVAINACSAGSPAVTTGYTTRGSTTETLVSDKHIDTATTETATFTCASGVMIRSLIALREFTVGQTISVGQITETELAQAVAWSPQNRLVGLITETELAQAIAGAQTTRLLGLVTETELAQAITLTRMIAIAQATETELAQAVTWLPTRLIVAATETELAQTLTRAKALGLTQAEETSLAQAMAWAPKARLISQAFEINSANPIDVGGAAPPAVTGDGAIVIILRRGRGR